MTRLIYGFDPLCGWCFGVVPALRQVQQALPDLSITLALPGLVTGGRVGPYAMMEGYIRGAAARLESVTGRAPSPAFFDLITRPGVVGQSGPPCLALAAARAVDPARAVDLAHRVIEAHFIDGADLNDPAIYPPLLKAAGVTVLLPDLHDPDATDRLWQAEQQWGIQSFPTLTIERASGERVTLPSIYDPERLLACVRTAIG
jgi:putative protein-disulfide isomerase